MLAEGRKDDHGKLPWHLLPPDAIDQILWVLQHGATRYGERNWEIGMHWSRPFSALMRHMWAWWRGEVYDADTGASHLAHAGCCILFLLAYEQRGIGSDDRPLSGIIPEPEVEEAPDPTISGKISKDDIVDRFQLKNYPALEALRRAADGTKLQPDTRGSRGA